ncbi:hypothetical protein ADUPG1_009229, partial [Aduncisulcus paluster]
HFNTVSLMSSSTITKCKNLLGSLTVYNTSSSQKQQSSPVLDSLRYTAVAEDLHIDGVLADTDDQSIPRPLFDFKDPPSPSVVGSNPSMTTISDFVPSLLPGLATSSYMLLTHTHTTLSSAIRSVNALCTAVQQVGKIAEWYKALWEATGDDRMWWYGKRIWGESKETKIDDVTLNQSITNLFTRSNSFKMEYFKLQNHSNNIQKIDKKVEELLKILGKDLQRDLQFVWRCHDMKVIVGIEEEDTSGLLKGSGRLIPDIFTTPSSPNKAQSGPSLMLGCGTRAILHLLSWSVLSSLVSSMGPVWTSELIVSTIREVVTRILILFTRKDLLNISVSNSQTGVENQRTRMRSMEIIHEDAGDDDFDEEEEEEEEGEKKKKKNRDQASLSFSSLSTRSPEVIAQVFDPLLSALMFLKDKISASISVIYNKRITNETSKMPFVPQRQGRALRSSHVGGLDELMAKSIEQTEMFVRFGVDSYVSSLHRRLKYVRDLSYGHAELWRGLTYEEKKSFNKAWIAMKSSFMGIVGEKTQARRGPSRRGQILPHLTQNGELLTQNIMYKRPPMFGPDFTSHVSLWQYDPVFIAKKEIEGNDGAQEVDVDDISLYGKQLGGSVMKSSVSSAPGSSTRGSGRDLPEGGMIKHNRRNKRDSTITLVFRHLSSLPLLDTSIEGRNVFHDVIEAYTRILGGIESELGKRIASELSEAAKKQDTKLSLSIYRENRRFLSRERVSSQVRHCQDDLVCGLEKRVEILLNSQSSASFSLQHASSRALDSIRGVDRAIARLLWAISFHKQLHIIQTQLISVLGSGWKEVDRGKKVKDDLKTCKKKRTLPHEIVREESIIRKLEIRKFYKRLPLIPSEQVSVATFGKDIIDTPSEAQSDYENKLVRLESMGLRAQSTTIEEFLAASDESSGDTNKMIVSSLPVFKLHPFLSDSSPSSLSSLDVLHNLLRTYGKFLERIYREVGTEFGMEESDEKEEINCVLTGEKILGSDDSEAPTRVLSLDMSVLLQHPMLQILTQSLSLQGRGNLHVASLVNLFSSSLSEYHQLESEIYRSACMFRFAICHDGTKKTTKDPGEAKKMTRYSYPLPSHILLASSILACRILLMHVRTMPLRSVMDKKYSKRPIDIDWVERKVSEMVGQGKKGSSSSTIHDYREESDSLKRSKSQFYLSSARSDSSRPSPRSSHRRSSSYASKNSTLFDDNGHSSVKFVDQKQIVTLVMEYGKYSDGDSPFSSCMMPFVVSVSKLREKTRKVEEIRRNFERLLTKLRKEANSHEFGSNIMMATFNSTKSTHSKISSVMKVINTEGLKLGIDYSCTTAFKFATDCCIGRILGHAYSRACTILGLSIITNEASSNEGKDGKCPPIVCKLRGNDSVTSGGSSSFSTSPASLLHVMSNSFSDIGHTYLDHKCIAESPVTRDVPTESLTFAPIGNSFFPPAVLSVVSISAQTCVHNAENERDRLCESVEGVWRVRINAVKDQLRSCVDKWKRSSGKKELDSSNSASIGSVHTPSRHPEPLSYSDRLYSVFVDKCEANEMKFWCDALQFVLFEKKRKEKEINQDVEEEDGDGALMTVHEDIPTSPPSAVEPTEKRPGPNVMLRNRLQLDDQMGFATPSLNAKMLGTGATSSNPDQRGAFNITPHLKKSKPIDTIAEHDIISLLFTHMHSISKNSREDLRNILNKNTGILKKKFFGTGEESAVSSALSPRGDRPSVTSMSSVSESKGDPLITIDVAGAHEEVLLKLG